MKNYWLMCKLLKWLLVIQLVQLFITASVFGQTTSTRLTIQGVELYSTATSDGESNFEYMANTWFGGIVSPNCIDFNNVGANQWHAIKPTDQYRGVNIVNTNGTFKFEVETWEDDGCKDFCGYNTSCADADEAQCTRRGAFLNNSTDKLVSDLHPGDHVGNEFTASLCNTYWVKFKAILEPPQTLPPAIQFGNSSSSLASYDGSNICDKSWIGLTTQINLLSFKNEVNYNWEYYFELKEISNSNYCGDQFQCVDFPDSPCCLEPPTVWVPDWKTIAGSTNAAVANGLKTFNIRALPGLSSITENTNVYFRATPTANSVTGAFSDPSLVVHLSPAGPSSINVTAQSSCIARPTGVITINSISGGTGFPYKVAIRTGNNTSPCDPDLGNCGEIINAGNTSINSAAELPKTFSAGNRDYTVLIVNGGGFLGSCYKAQVLTVDSIPKLKVYNLLPVNISCYDNSEGYVSFATRDGDVNVRAYSLRNNTSGALWTSPSVSGATATFNSLPVGAYTVTIHDGIVGNTGCSPDVSKPFTITRPKKITGSDADFSADPKISCASIADGKMSVIVGKTGGSFETNISSIYHYRLYKNGSFLEEKFTSDINASWNNLSSGSYELAVTEQGGQWCNRYSKTFTIAAPDPLGISALNLTPVKCNGASSGSVAFTASGGRSSYSFELTRGATVITNTASNFPGLSAGNYNLTVAATSPVGCSDSYIYPNVITIAEPPPVNFAITSTNPACFQSDNGTASATVSGGTPAYSYAWQKRSGADWVGVPSGSGPVVNNLLPGNYRLNVMYSGDCIASSNPIDIIEPGILKINSVASQHIACYGEKGTLLVNSTGGNSPYSSQYSDDDGDTYKPLVPLLAGTYLIKVVDSKGCQAIDDNYHTLTAPDEPLDFNYELSDHNGYTNSCFGDNTGIITLTASGGNDYGYSGYSFTKDAGIYSVSNIVNTINAGSHSISVKDGRGCIVSKNVAFTQPEQLTLSLVRKQNVVCYGLATGELEVEAGGGFGSHQFRIGTSTPQSNGLFTGITSGNYTIAVTDDNTCQTILNETITNLNPAIGIIPAVTDVQCFGGGDGKIALTVNGGVSPYQYAVGITAAGNPVTNLIAGTYKVTVTDSEGCKGDYSNISVGQPAAVSITNVQVTDIRCFSEKGAITIAATGGTTPYRYEYSLDNGSTHIPFTAMTPLNAGNYKLRTVDSHNCILEHASTFAITAPPARLDFTYQLSDYHGYNITCNGLQDGTIKVTPAGGNGASYVGYAYQVDTRTYQTDNAINTINAGNHAVNVKDARGCVTTKTIAFTEAAPVVTSLSQKQDVICFGASTGEIKAGATGGTNVYEYRLDAAPYESSSVFSALKPANYVVTARDQNGCEASFNQSIVNLNAPITIQLNVVNDVSCYEGSDGSIKLDIAGGVSPYQYKIANQSASNPAIALAAGTYRVTVVDQKGCEKDSEGIEVRQPDDLIISKVDVSDIRCFNEKATIALTVAGGTEAYTFEYDLLNDGVTMYKSFTPSTPLSAGDYKVRVKDIHNCLSLLSDAKVTQPPLPLDFSYILSDYNGHNISCFGGYNGHITLTPSGGNGASYTGYEYTIDNKSYQAGNKLLDIYAGNHIVAVRDGRQCVVEKTINFTQSSEEIKAYIARRKDVNCIESLNGEIEVKANGGATPYKYRLAEGTFQNSSTFTGLKVDSYRIIISDVNDCAIGIESFITNLTREMEFAPFVKDVSCFEGRDGSIDLTVNGGASPFNYKWAGMSSNAKKITSLESGTYTVLVTDNVGCKKESFITVDQPASALEVTATSTAACYDKSDGLVNIQAKGGTAPYEYSVDDGQCYRNASLFNVAIGNYPVKVRDVKGCLATTSTLVAQRISKPEPNFLVAITRNALDTLVLTEICVPQPDSIHWTFDNNASIIDNDQWTPKIKFKQPGAYPVTMQVFFGGCDYSITKTLSVNPFDPIQPEEKLPGFKAIESIVASPNPTKGDLKVDIKLTKKYNLSLVLIDMLGVIHYRKHWASVQGISETIPLESASAGVYMLRAITENGAEDVRIVVVK